MLRKWLKDVKNLHYLLPFPLFQYLRRGSVAEAERLKENHFIKRLPAKPPLVSIELSSACNLNCKMCDTKSARRTQGVMSVALFERSIKELTKLNYTECNFISIGEPLLNKHYHDISRIAYENNIKYELITNGLLIDRHIDTLMKYPPSAIRISIDAGTKTSYEAIRAGANFEKLRSNIELLLASIKQKKRTIHLGASYLVTADTLRELPDFAKNFYPYFQPEQITYQLVGYRSSNALDSEYLNNDETFLTEQHQQIPCSLLWSRLYILQNGDVSACCRDFHGDFIIGNIEQQSLADIWHGAPLNQLRNDHINRNLENLDLCKNCYSQDRVVAAKLHLYLRWYTKNHPDFKANDLVAFINDKIPEIKLPPVSSGRL